MNLILDAGALIAYERNSRSMAKRKSSVFTVSPLEYRMPGRSWNV